MTLAYVVAGILGLALTVYALTGGADFGGGAWDLLARGPRAEKQRNLIEHAIAPIWEANHVWMIVVVVIMFVAFPSAFAALGTVLHVPLTIVLFGIVLRGSAFTFRSYGMEDAQAQRRWSRVFAISSLLTPLFLGACIGAVASGRIRIDAETGRVVPDYFSSWLAPFPIAVGVLTLLVFAFLAAVYLAVEAKVRGDAELADDFRRRAMWTWPIVGAMAWFTLYLARGNEELHHGLTGPTWTLVFHVVTGILALGAQYALWRKAYRPAQLLSGALIVALLWGWMQAQAPYLIIPDVTFADAAAPAGVLRMLLWVLGIGSLFLVPAFAYLYYIFKSKPKEG